MTVAGHRVLQYIAIILILAVGGGGYWYWQNAQAGAVQKTASNRGLIAYWSFDDGDGTSVGDASGSGKHLTLGTAPQTPVWIDGRFGKALSFDGVQDTTGDIANIPSVVLGTTHTISMWVYPIPAGHTNYQSLFDQDCGAGLYYHSGTDKRINYFYNSDHLSTGTLTENAWNHVAVVTSAGSATFYINGAAAGTAAGVPAYTALTMGGDSCSEAFKGSIDETRVYNRALGATEITALYDLGAAKIGLPATSPGTLSDGLAGYWTFDGQDMIGGVLDASGNGNIGSLVNYGAAIGVPGIAGQALGFSSASSQYVNIPNTAANLSPGTGDFAASFWYKGSPSGGFFSGDALGADGEWDIGSGGGREFYFVANDFAATAYGNFAMPSDTNWHHVVLMLDRSTSPVDTFSAYVDGASVAVTIVSNEINGQNIGSDAITLGNQGAFNGAPYRNTPMDEVRVYNRLLTASEIQRLYALGATKVAKNLTPSGSLQTGLTGYWTFDGADVSGTTATEKSGYPGVNATLVDGVIPTIGKVGQALSFDGTDDYVDAGTLYTNFITPSTGTVSVWMRPRGTVPDVTDGTIYNIRNAVSTLSQFDAFGIGVGNLNSGGAKIFAFNDVGCGSYSKIGTSYVNDEWTHIVWMHSGGTLSLYKNGSLAGSISSADTYDCDAPGNLVIGTTWNGAGTFFNGDIDEVRTYNRALTASEITELYDLGH